MFATDCSRGEQAFLISRLPCGDFRTGLHEFALATSPLYLFSLSFFIMFFTHGHSKFPQDESHLLHVIYQLWQTCFLRDTLGCHCSFSALLFCIELCPGLLQWKILYALPAYCSYVPYNYSCSRKHCPVLIPGLFFTIHKINKIQKKDIGPN